MSDTNTPRSKAIDYTPLAQPVSLRDVREYKRQVRTTEDKNAFLGERIALGIFIVVAGLTWAVVALVVSLHGTGTAAPTIVIAAIWSLILLGVAAALQGQYKRTVRVTRFAAANDLGFRKLRKDHQPIGMIFGIGTQREQHNVISSKDGAFEFGEHRYTTGTGKYRRVHYWNYLRIRLDRALPHMVLDATANNVGFGPLRLSNLPVPFDRDQVLSLEGDFDKYFTLYAPRDYERDALYIFAPDLMALFVDHGAAFDAEIVDNNLFIYSKKAKLDDPRYLAQLFAIIDKVGQKTSQRSERYQDERAAAADVAARQVAEPGRRLKRSVSLVAIIIVILLVLFQVLPSIIQLFTDR